MKRIVLLFIIAGAGLLTAWCVERSNPIGEGLACQARRFEAILHSREIQAAKWLKEPTRFDTRLRLQAAAGISGAGLFLFERDQLVYWSDPSLPTGERVPDRTGSGLLRLSDGYYLSLSGSRSGVFAEILLPVYRDYPIQGVGLRHHFPLVPDAPASIGFSTTPPGAPIHDHKGAVLGYLQAPAPLPHPGLRRWSLLLFGVGSLALMLALEKRQRHRPAAESVGLLIAAVVGLRFLGAATFVLPSSGSAVALLTTSLGLLKPIDAILIIGCSYLLERYLSRSTVSTKLAESVVNRFPKLARQGLIAVSYGILVSLLTGLSVLIRQAVLNSSLYFDFDNIFHLTPTAILSLLVVSVLLQPIHRFAETAIRLTRQSTLPPWERRLSALAGVLPAGWLGIYFLPELPVLESLFILLIFLILLDLYIDYRRQSLTWLIIWLVFFSALTAILFFKFYLERQTVDLLQKARTSIPADQHTEEEAEMDALAWRLKADSLVSRTAAVPYPFQISTPAIRDSLASIWNAFPRLALSYTFDPFLYNPFYRNSLLAEIEWPALQRQLQRLSDAGDPVSPFLTRLPGGSYALQVAIPIPGNDKLSNELLLILSPRAYSDESVAGRLLRPFSDGGLGEAEHMAILKAGRLLYQRGSPALNWIEETMPAPGAWSRRLNSERVDLAYGATGGRTILVGRSLGGYARPLALFSFFFALLLFLAFIDAGIGALITGKYRQPAGSLRFRLQLTVITLIGGAFVLIGLVTVSAFRKSALQEQRERLYEKIRAIRLELAAETSFNTPSQIAERLAGAHQIDLALYDGNGGLSGSSDFQLYTFGILPSRVTASFLRGDSPGEKGVFIQRSKAGAVDYQTTFTATGLPRSSPAAFIGLSLPTSDYRSSRDLYTFIGSLINVYVFLLLAASVIAIAVANSITRPLDHIGEKLQMLRLGRNEPLEWRGDDEIGQLVGAYNTMIAQLEESARQLRRSEREGAWREMAKQVAHEIKNPLTPMKLSIQHLERAYRTDPDHARELVLRVSRTLVEQIDALSRIANEFSSFAKMPRPENDRFALQELLASAFHLFAQNPEYQARFTLQLPEDPLFVFADRSQLLRVLNNLIKNALQALQDNRPGEITIALWQADNKGVIRIRDNGAGISEEVRERVFYPNFTTKSSGMGLGLALCKGMIEQMEGSIYFETTLGKGSDFYVELPLVGVHSGDYS